MSDYSGVNIGRYHIIKVLGEGGMATVYQAMDLQLEREVAIKFLRQDEFSPKALSLVLLRFKQEVKALAKLQHPNIVGVLDYGEYQGAPYLVMIYLAGGTLKDYLKRASNGRLSVAEAASIAAGIARGLDHAHQRGIIHRDVKPANILLSEDGRPMLSDFGIAKLLENQNGYTLTGTGVGIGTPTYMAPEQAEARTVDGRADIYALGIVFYEMVTGRAPFTADTPLAVLMKHKSDPLPRPRDFAPDVPEEVEKVLFKALAKNPNDRYADMATFAAVLDRLARLTPEAEKPEATGLQDERTQVMTHESVALEQEVLNEPRETVLDGKEEEKALRQPPTAKKPLEISKKARLIGGVIAGVLFLALIGTILISAWVQQGRENGTGPLAFLAANTSSVSLTPAAGAMQISSMDGMAMVYIPAGEFSMGTSDQELDRLLAAHKDWQRNLFANEQPAHTVYLDGYWIDKFEVTNKQYALCVAAGKCNPPSDSNSNTQDSYYGNSEFDNYPVIYVNWNDARSYCEWAGRALPSEAQWEKAARGTDGRTYPWGNSDPDSNLINYNGNAGDTTAAGSYRDGQSPYGALDMAGNVWEWAADRYDKNYYSASSSESPIQPETGDYRSVRGGSWLNDEWYARSAGRGGYDPNSMLNRLGFRCSLMAVP